MANTKTPYDGAASAHRRPTGACQFGGEAGEHIWYNSSVQPILALLPLCYDLTSANSAREVPRQQPSWSGHGYLFAKCHTITLVSSTVETPEIWYDVERDPSSCSSRIVNPKPPLHSHVLRLNLSSKCSEHRRQLRWASWITKIPLRLTYIADVATYATGVLGKHALIRPLNATDTCNV